MRRRPVSATPRGNNTSSSTTNNNNNSIIVIDDSTTDEDNSILSTLPLAGNSSTATNINNSRTIPLDSTFDSSDSSWSDSDDEEARHIESDSDEQEEEEERETTLPDISHVFEMLEREEERDRTLQRQRPQTPAYNNRNPFFQANRQPNNFNTTFPTTAFRTSQNSHSRHQNQNQHHHNHNHNHNHLIVRNPLNTNTMDQQRLLFEFLSSMRSARGNPTHQGTGSIHPLMFVNRDFDERDYEMLLALDDQIEKPKKTAASAVGKLPLVNIEEKDCTCSICLDDLEVGSFASEIPFCNHKFHTDCIEKWLKDYGHTCPVCKQEVTEIDFNHVQLINEESNKKKRKGFDEKDNSEESRLKKKKIK